MKRSALEQARVRESTSNDAGRGRRKWIFVSPWSVRPGAGVNNVILGLGSALAKHYDPVIVCTAWARPSGDQIWCKLGTPSLPLRNLLAYWILFLPNLFRLLLVTRGAAVVNPHFVGLQHLPFAFLRAIKLGPPLIFSVHGADVAGILKGSRAQRILCRWMYAKADLIVACSTALSADARRVNPRANVVVIWNGVSAPDVSQCERRLNARYIVSVASFHFHKGHDILLEAFDRISHIQTDLQLVLIGNNGPNLTRVQQDIRERKLENKTHVIVDVPHREVWFWLSHAECLVLASRSEPFGLCLVEAALTKTPVVATAVGGIPEIVAGGLHGLLSPPEDPEALAAAILKTLSEKAETADRVRRFHTFASTLTWENASNAYREHARLD